MRTSRPRWSFVVALALALAACAGRKPVAEPRLADSPAALEQAIGLTLLQTGEPRRALPHLQRLIRLAPAQADARCWLARAYLDLGLWQQAAATLDEAVARWPRHAPAHALRGILLDVRGEHAAAVLAHRQAIALAPGDAAYHNNLGFSLYLAGDDRGAAAALEAALALAPGLRRIHNNLGFVYGRLGQLDRAGEHFRLAGDAGQAANNLGVVLEARGALEEAYQAYGSALAAAPELAEARHNFERVAARLGRSPAAPEGRE